MNKGIRVKCRYCKDLIFIEENQSKPIQCPTCLNGNNCDWMYWDPPTKQRSDLTPLIRNTLAKQCPDSSHKNGKTPSSNPTHNSTTTVSDELRYTQPSKPTCCDRYKGLFKYCQKCGKELK